MYFYAPLLLYLSESQLDELAMEVLLLMFILPAVQEQNHTREWLKQLIRAWCAFAAWMLNLRSYLFGDVPLENPEEEKVEEEQPAGPGAVVQAIRDLNNLRQQEIARLNPDPEPEEEIEEEEEDVQEGNEEENENANEPANNARVEGGLGAVHQALLLREAPTGFQPYNKPTLFALRVSVWLNEIILISSISRHLLNC